MPRTNAVVLDFDGTLTRYGTYLVDVVNSRVGGTLRAALEDLDAYYRPRVHEHTITPEEEREWGLRTFDIYIRHGLSRAMVRRALADIRVRPGVPEFLSRLRREHVPFAVVSYGFKPFIRIVMANSGIDPEGIDIFAAELRFGRNGKMTSFDESTYVLPEMKGDVSRAFADRHGIPHRGLIAVGDSSGDRFLGHLKRNRLGICETGDRIAYLRPYFGKVLMLPDGHFAPAERWVRSRIADIPE